MNASNFAALWIIIRSVETQYTFVMSVEKTCITNIQTFINEKASL